MVREVTDRSIGVGIIGLSPRLSLIGQIWISALMAEGPRARLHPSAAVRPPRKRRGKGQREGRRWIGHRDEQHSKYITNVPAAASKAWLIYCLRRAHLTTSASVISHRGVLTGSRLPGLERRAAAAAWLPLLSLPLCFWRSHSWSPVIAQL